MMRILFTILTVFTLAVFADAQKITSGGKPKPYKTTGVSKAYEVKFSNGVAVRKFDRKTEDDMDGFFQITRGGKVLGEMPASTIQAASIDKFDAFYGDLDKNNSAELIVVDFDSQSLGMGISYYSIYIFPDFETKGWQEPLSFSTQEYGAQGTFVYDAKANETLILVTDFDGLENISAKPGTYFVGRFFRYRDGLLKPATDKPIYARRYLNSFEKTRYATENNPRRPWLWLNTPQAQKLTVDPEFSLKSLQSESGIIERVEIITRKDEENQQETKLRQLVLKMNSGEEKIVALWEQDLAEARTDEKGKIFPVLFGVAPSNISLPREVSPLKIWKDLTGRKIILNSYPPYSLDENKSVRYKLLFVD